MRESIGSCGDGQLPHERDWIVFCQEIAIAYIRHVCGDPPKLWDIEIEWWDHELGSYPEICLTCDESPAGVPWAYHARCERALSVFDEAVAWGELRLDENLAREGDEG